MARLHPLILRFVELPATERRLGPFQLVEPLGHGGFAPVWLAREVYGTSELRTAAVKLFPLDTAGTAAAAEDGLAASGRRIVAEARALCSVEHPNVVRFYALPMDEARGVMGLAMEHVAGVSLDERIARRGRLGVVETLAIGAAVASALAAVHRAGLTHRDVKPANVIDAAGVYKLIDFGIAAADALGPGGVVSDASEAPRAPAPANGSADPLATQPIGAMWGTVGYVDPGCVASGEPASAASDLYALGATLFQCLTGRVPAAAHGGAKLDLAIVEGRAAAPALASLAPETPAALAELISTLLSRTRATRPASAESVALRLTRIHGEAVGASRALPPETVGPFRGLGRFKESDRDLYFGRSGEMAAAVEMLRARGVVALVGPSGSGKSSLARAGVAPLVVEGALGEWPTAWDCIVVEPGHDPRASIREALAGVIPGSHAAEPAALVGALATRAQTTGRGTMLVVDPLEELVTLAAASDRAWAAKLLRAFAEPALPGVRALVAVRRDLLDPLLAIEGLGSVLIRGSVLVEPLSSATWGMVLEQALAAYGYSFEDDALRDTIVAEIKRTEGAMPLVQFALTELWEKRDTAARRITLAGLEAIGGIAGVLDRHAEATLDELAEGLDDAPRIARATLLALTTATGTRAARSLDELVAVAGPRAVEVVDAFARARLVITDAGNVQLGHEALLVQWTRLARWVEEARDERLLLEELERDAARWRAEPGLTPPWRRLRLATAEESVTRGGVASPLARAFLRAGRSAERRASLALAFTAVLLVGVGVATATAYVRGVTLREDAMRSALEREQASRAVAEERTLEVQEAQARIDRLNAEIAKSPSPELVSELLRQVDAARAIVAAPAPRPGGSLPKAVRVAPAVDPVPAEVEKKPPAPPPQPAASAVAPRILDVEMEWGEAPNAGAAKAP